MKWADGCAWPPCHRPALTCDDDCDQPSPHGHPSLKGQEFIGNLPFTPEVGGKE